MSSIEVLDAATQSFENLTHKLENYLSIQENAVPSVKELTKVLYDFTKNEEDSTIRSTALPELIIQDFDEEQIWQQIEMQNDYKWNGLLSNVSKFLTLKDAFNIPLKILDCNKNSESNMSDSGESVLNEGKIESDDMLSKINTKKKCKKSKKKQDHLKGKKVKSSIVDDKFFKLNELEAFLDAQDKAEMNKMKKQKKPLKRVEESSEEDEDEEIDMFAESEDEGMMLQDEEADSKQIKYRDFYEDDSKSGDSEENESLDEEAITKSDDLGFDDENGEDDFDSDIDLTEIKGNNKGKKVHFEMEQPSSDDDDESGNEENDDIPLEEKAPEILSELQLRQQRLKKKINHIENSMFEEKAWPMKGEVTATNRPQNSLLEEVVDFDTTSRPAPIITEETTLKLQDIIIQRIKDKAWDDVERKIKPVEDVQEFKKQLVLDQEKSKLSLAQVYEQEFIKQREALDPDADEKPEDEPKEHVEIRSLLSSLFSKLDALCHYHYTPKIAAPEVKIVSNMPAISMEEVAPVATSDATLLAPEEIRGKAKGDVIGKTERTATDKKRERRKKKLRQREKEKERQKKENNMDKTKPGLGNKYGKNKTSKLLDKVTKDRNVNKMEMIGDGKALKSSSAFFTQLQEEVSSSIKSTLKRANNKKNKNSISAKRIKL